jgi:hypothetical protein
LPSPSWNSAGVSVKLALVLDFDRNPRTNGSRVRSALEANGCSREFSPEISSMARALAASKRAGSFLCLGAGAGEVGAWILDAMDYASGLVALVQDRGEAAVLEREFDRDVRASVHLQDAESFLIDVRAHRFDLIVDLIADAHPRVVRLGLGALRAGGVYLGCHLESLSGEAFAPGTGGSGAQAAPLDPEDFEFARFGERLDARLIVRRTLSGRHRRRSRAKAR